jgi:glycine cleavage system transcriptional repressor
LADLGVNVVDLTTRVIGERERPVYFMVLEVTLPSSVPAPAVASRLEELAAELGVECTLHPSEADIL